MPMLAKTVAGGQALTSPWVAGMGPTLHAKIDLSTLTTPAEVTSDGYLKGGVPFGKPTANLHPLVGASPDYVWGVSVEATKLNITTPVTSATLAAETGDHFVALCIGGAINRDAGEDLLGRAYSANELAGFAAAGSLV